MYMNVSGLECILEDNERMISELKHLRIAYDEMSTSNRVEEEERVQLNFDVTIKFDQSLRDHVAALYADTHKLSAVRYVTR
jgi:regulator of replication initiation timing